mgnify:CR=1 FL=1
MASTSASSVGPFLLSATLTVLGISETHGPMVLPWSALCIGYTAAARSATGGATSKTPSCGLVVVAVATPWILPILRGGARRLRYRHRDFRPRRTLLTQSAVLDGGCHCSLTTLAAASAFFTAIKNPLPATAKAINRMVIPSRAPMSGARRPITTRSRAKRMSRTPKARSSGTAALCPAFDAASLVLVA